jgi:hypothetical protein
MPGNSLPFENGSLSAHVFQEAVRFLEKARVHPLDAFSQYANKDTGDYFREIGEQLWQTVHPELGWRWFFYGALMTMAEEGGAAGGDEHEPEHTALEFLVSFYHPWSDTALITAWAAAGEHTGTERAPGTVYIRDCEVLMGDIFRSRGKQRAASTRAWARRQQYFAASIGHVTATSLRSLELLSFASNESPASGAIMEAETNKRSAPLGTSPSAWRNRIPFLAEPDNLEANHAGAAILMLAAINDIARYSAPTNVFAIRVLPTLQRLHSPTNTIKIAPEARQTLQAIPKNFMEYYVPAFYANSHERAFLMLQAKRDPKKCLAFLFGLEPPEGEESESKKKNEEAALPPERALKGEEDELEDEGPGEMYPEAYYAIKLLRIDLMDFQSVYTNLYPVGEKE